MENKILVVLDDLWKEHNLDAIGIPCKSKGLKGCKILITSRDRDVVNNEMNAQRCFWVEPLSKEESWEFFKNTIGDFDKTSIEPTAKEVANECAGLPIALAIVGKALKGKTLNIWKDALKQLENPIAVNIKGVSDKVYSSIKMSYDFIQSEEAKLIFRLCSVFPDDYEINLEYLSMYAMGMKLLNDINTWDEARNRMMKLVDDLKSASLLLESEDNHVKMHDVIRDVAIYISTKEGQMSTLSHGYKWSEWQEKDRCGPFRAIFVNCEDFNNLPHNLKFPELELLIFFTELVKEMKLQISDTFFAGMENLKVLDLTGIYFLQSTMSITHSLANLRMLYISWCVVEDIEKICELKELEILGIEHCPIRELPETMSQLKKLKKLQVTNCSSLSVIPPNVFSSMMKLEELNLLGFLEWGKEVLYRDKLILNSKLSELKCLVNLTCLKLTLQHDKILFDAFPDNLKLERFVIIVGSDYHSFRHLTFLRYLDLAIKSKTVSNDAVNKILMARCDGLRLKAYVGITKILFKPNGNGYPHLRHLSLSESSDMRHLISDQLGNHCPNYFSSLDTLKLNEMKSLKNIVHMHVQAIPFNKLRCIQVTSCTQLRNLFSFSIFNGLSNLEEIEVNECILMGEIVFMESEDTTIKTECNSSLTTLRLSSVDQLTSFCSKQLTHQHSENNLIPFFDDQVAFPQLEYLHINKSSNLQRIWKNNGLIANSFCKLREIRIQECKNLRFIFPPNIMTTLDSLEELEFEGCELLEGIFEKEEPTVKEKDVLLKLRSIYVRRCPKLKSLFPFSIKCLQQLEDLSIDASLELFSEVNASPFSSSKILFPNLRSLSMPCNAMKRDCWLTQFSRLELLPNLKKLCFKSVGDDHDNSIAWPLGSCQLLFSVKKLEIEKCNSLIEVLFPEEGHNRNGRRANLKELRLFFLSNLTSVWKDNTETAILFDSLENLSVSKCDKLKYLIPSTTTTFSNLKVVSVDMCGGMKNLMSWRVAKSLVKLEELTVYSCTEMISIVEEEEGDGDEENDEIIFSKLVELKLVYLPKLASFHIGECNCNCKLIFPCLERLVINECPQMKVFFNGIMSTTKQQHHLLVHERLTQVTFPQLEQLKIKGGKNLDMFWKNNGSFYKLEVIEIERCNTFRFIFPPHTMTTLVSLEKLKIVECELLEGIFEKEEPNVKEKDVLPKLRSLCVRRCPQLKSLFPTSIKPLQLLEDLSIDESLKLFQEDNVSSSFEILFPMLRKLWVPCNAMKTDCWLIQFLGSEWIPNFKVLCFDGPNDHDNKITLSLGSCQLLYNVEELEIENCDSLIEILFSDECNNCNGRRANLKELTLFWLPNLTHLWKDKTETTTLFDSLEVLRAIRCEKLKSLLPSTTTSFSNLKVISAWYCKGMKNLMSWRVAKSLVKLEELLVNGCREMISIVEEEEGDGEEENNEIIFPKLVKLALDELPKLASFHIGECNCKFIFPCLEMLEIYECPEMKIFSNGIISAPQLQHHPLIHGRR